MLCCLCSCSAPPYRIGGLGLQNPAVPSPKTPLQTPAPVFTPVPPTAPPLFPLFLFFPTPLGSGRAYRWRHSSQAAHKMHHALSVGTNLPCVRAGLQCQLSHVCINEMLFCMALVHKENIMVFITPLEESHSVPTLPCGPTDTSQSL